PLLDEFSEGENRNPETATPRGSSRQARTPEASRSTQMLKSEGQSVKSRRAALAALASIAAGCGAVLQAGPLGPIATTDEAEAKLLMAYRAGDWRTVTLMATADD